MELHRKYYEAVARRDRAYERWDTHVKEDGYNNTCEDCIRMSEFYELMRKQSEELYRRCFTTGSDVIIAVGKWTSAGPYLKPPGTST